MGRNVVRKVTPPPTLAGLTEADYRTFDTSEPIPQEIAPAIESVIEREVSALFEGEGGFPYSLSGADTAAEILTSRLLAVLRDVVQQLPAPKRAKAYHDAVWTLKGND